jgi:hypothetical protein
MKAWWQHHHSKTPHFETDADKKMAEDLTGCIPLLLRPFLKWGGRNFREVEDKIWNERDILEVRMNITRFSNDLRNKGGPDHDTLVWKTYTCRPAVDLSASYVEAMFRCLLHLDVGDVPLHLFDYRYFYPEETGHGRCTNGCARDVAESIIRGKNPDKFLSNEYLNSMLFFARNSSVLGSMAEQSCLSAIGTFGFNHGKLHFIPTNRKEYNDEPDLFTLLPKPGEQCSTLFVPNNPRNPHIDGLYLKVTNTTALVAPIQITISNKRRHSDSEGGFYAGWKAWQDRFKDHELSTMFVWIVGDENDWKEIEERHRQLRNRLQVIVPNHSQATLPIKKVYTPLGVVLAQCRAQCRALATPALTGTPRGPTPTESDPPVSEDTVLGEGVSIDKKKGKGKRSEGEVKKGRRKAKGMPA